jgi:uracil-DNA glycosylase
MDTDQIARQWLETDAAFGVTEVPLAAPARSAPQANAGAMPAPPARPQPAPPRPVVAPARPAPAPREAAPAGMFGDVSGRAPVPGKKVLAAMPATPAGLIADLPPMTRKEKEAAFEALRREIDEFAKPFINKISTRTVFGEGDIDAALMFVGEGPGAEEDRTGRPFVGRSGQLLDKMIAALKYKREQVFICNVVKLRAADWTEDGSRLQDRPPNPEEVARWIPYLHRQIEIIRPKVIVTLGAPAIKHLTGTTEGVMKIRGTWLSYRGIPVMPTYHPSFVLRAYTEENRRKVWSDLQAAQKKIQES